MDTEERRKTNPSMLSALLSTAYRHFVRCFRIKCLDAPRRSIKDLRGAPEFSVAAATSISAAPLTIAEGLVGCAGSGHGGWKGIGTNPECPLKSIGYIPHVSIKDSTPRAILCICAPVRRLVTGWLENETKGLRTGALPSDTLLLRSVRVERIIERRCVVSPSESGDSS
jgi:hypothetical protein